MELIKFKDFNRVQVSTVYQRENIEFVIINLEQSIFYDIITSWISITNEKTCQFLYSKWTLKRCLQLKKDLTG